MLLDTAPLIAYLEGGQKITPAVKVLMDAWVHDGRNTALISVISASKLLVGPKRAGRGEADVVDFLKHYPNVMCIDVDFAIAQDAAQLRASTKLKMPDALIIATGASRGAGAIVTNDRAWTTLCPSLPIVTLGDFV